MKKLKKIIILTSMMCLSSANSYVKADELTYRMTVNNSNISMTEDSLISNKDYSDMLVNVVKTRNGQQSTIYSGNLGGYENGLYSKTDFSRINYMIIFEWDSMEDEAIYIIPATNQSTISNLSGISQKNTKDESTISLNSSFSASTLKTNMSLMYNDKYYENVLLPGQSLNIPITKDITMLDRNFTGGTSNQTVTIPFDLTPVIKKVFDRTGFTEKTTKRLYVEVTDDVDNGYNITLGDVTIVEPMTGKTLKSSNVSDLVANNNSVKKTIDFEITPFVGFDDRQDITLVFNSNVQAESIVDNIYLLKDSEIIYPECEVMGNKIVVYSPESGYISDTDYELHISTNVKSKGGNRLQNEKIIMLYMLDEYYVYW